jgi:hypothetical protein
VDQSGRPFRVQGDTGWEASTEATLDRWRSYLDDRKRRGFNTILMQMTSANNNYPGSKAPAAVGAGGALPFLRNSSGGAWDGDPLFASDLNKHNPAPGHFDADFSSPNPAYWSWIHQMVEEANKRNMLMILTVAYFGYNQGAQDGWWRTLINHVNTQQVSFGFGRYIGETFKDLPNIIWEMGVDTVPPAGSEGEARALEILKGVQAAGDTHLWTAHWVHDVLATDSAAFAPHIDVEGVYTHGVYPEIGPTYGRARLAYDRQPAKPSILLETTYEGGRGATRADERAFMWGAALSGSGAVFGSTDVWLFSPGSEVHLDTPATRDMERLGALMDGFPWEQLVPAGLDGVPDPIVTGHGSYTTMKQIGDGESGGMDWIIPSMTRDRRTFVAYVPSSHRGSFTVDMGTFAAPARVTWVDPTTSAAVDAGRYQNSDALQLVPPGSNAAGDRDWLLTITAG